MNDLNRELAPVSERAWRYIDTEATELLTTHMAARRLVDFRGPLGWDHSAIDLGSVEPLERSPHEKATIRKRRVRPLIELRVGFALDRDQLESIDRGARGVSFEPIGEAARLFAASEDTAVFDGYADAEIPGLLTDSGHEGVGLSPDATKMPEAFIAALERLRDEGVPGPYGAALAPWAMRALQASTGPGGYPVLKHVQRLVDGPLVWAPTLRGGVVMSLHGGVYTLVCGRDATIGYRGHDEKVVELYLEESFSAEYLDPMAAVPLVPTDRADGA